MVPLASDLKLMKDFLMTQANSSASALKKNNHDKEAYKRLLDTTFCQVLLLNRRRPGELQRLPLHIYNLVEDNSRNYEEFEDVVSQSEKILMTRFKRIVIRGKRGRGVPVLFSIDTQNSIEVLLKYRQNFLPRNNIYLFGNLNTLQPICGYKVLKKYAVLAGVKNAQAITATKMRKHLATLTQVLNMNENDIEQLSTFMGHTVGVHRGSYRLPDDVFQTAKISKLLMLMENGDISRFKGKSLDEIEITMNIESDDDSTSEAEPIPVNVDEAVASVESSSDPQKKGKPKRIHVPWSTDQKQTARHFFSSHIKRKVPPKKHECEEMKQNYPDLFDNKDWLKIKVFVQNEYNKKS